MAGGLGECGPLCLMLTRHDTVYTLQRKTHEIPVEACFSVCLHYVSVTLKEMIHRIYFSLFAFSIETPGKPCSFSWQRHSALTCLNMKAYW